jgi:type IV secretion system protein VirB10
MRMPWNRKRDEDFEEEEEVVEDQAIKGDRKIASVNKGLGVQARLTNFLIGALVVIAVGYFLVDYYAKLYQERAARANTPVDTTQTAQTTVPPLKLGALDQQQQQQPAGTPPPQPNIQQGKGSNGQPVETPAQIERRERLTSSVKFKLDGVTTTASTGQEGTPGSPGNPAPGSGGSGSQSGQDRLSQSLQGAQMDPIEAYKLGDPSLMVYQGESIPCTVQQAVDSSLVGQVTCIQSVDLWSADHSAIVAEAGTIYTGQQLMGLARGNRRLPIVWVRGRTPMPNNIAFNLNSAATDELGRTGITGEIDNHLAERWGPIVALSLIDDVGAYLSATGQDSSNSTNTNISFGNTTSGGQDLATEIFKESANIPSTLTRNQGANIYIYLARDVDFSKVYSLEYKE